MPQILNRKLLIFLTFTLTFFTGTASAAAVKLGPAPQAKAIAACPNGASAQFGTVETPCLAILLFSERAAQTERPAIVRGAGALVRFNYGVVQAAAALIPNESVYWQLVRHPNVEAVIPDRPVHAFPPPGACEPWPDCKNNDDDDGGSDGGGSTQEIPAGLLRIGAVDGWNYDVTGSGIGVAVVDTGLDSDHPDLVANFGGGVTCLDGVDGGCVNDGGEDDNGHGTHVGGTIAAVNNDADVVGVAHEATVYAAKVLDSGGSGTDSTVLAGLDWVAGNYNLQDPQIRVVNLSLGREGNCADMNDAGAIGDAIDALISAGISVVAAAGNDPTEEVLNMVPAGCDGAIAVASTTAATGQSNCKFISDIPADTASYFTTDDGEETDGTGFHITISAPGEKQEDNSCGTIQSVGILSLAMGGGTSRMSGTSMAAPHTTGVIALLYQQAGGTLDPDVARNCVSTGADIMTNAPKDSPTSSYTYDGEREGILSAPGALGSC